MTSDRPLDDAGADGAGPWLDGLAGRAGSGPDHAEGARIRAALGPGAQDAVSATWHDIEARARQGSGAGRPDAASAPDARVPRGLPQHAANDPRPWRRAAWAAVLVVGVGLVAVMSNPGSDSEPALRGTSGVQAPEPRWLVERPAQAAEELALELRGLDADVVITPDGPGFVLSIRAQPGALAAVNARLAPLETGLDAEGRLRLRVLPAR